MRTQHCWISNCSHGTSMSYTDFPYDAIHLQCRFKSNTPLLWQGKSMGEGEWHNTMLVGVTHNSLRNNKELILLKYIINGTFLILHWLFMLLRVLHFKYTGCIILHYPFVQNNAHCSLQKQIDLWTTNLCKLNFILSMCHEIIRLHLHSFIWYILPSCCHCLWACIDDVVSCCWWV